MDTTEDYDLLTHSSLKRQNKIRRKRHEGKLSQLAYTRSIERRNFEDKLILIKINKFSDTGRRDIVDRKPFVTNVFNGSTSLTSFVNSLRTETMARNRWDKLLLVSTANTNDVNILYCFNSITEAKVCQAKTSRTAEDYNLSKTGTL